MIPLLRDRHGPGVEILTEFAHPFVRSAWGDYIHRPRSGAVHGHGGRKWTCLTMWCGVTMSKSLMAFDEVPDGSEICGTCEGRYLGHLDDTGLIFAPSNAVDQWKPNTKWCPGPGQGLYIVTGPDSTAVCLLCGAHGNERARSGWNAWGCTMTRHHYASDRPKVFCPTCGYRDLHLADTNDETVIVCRQWQCQFQHRVAAKRVRRTSALQPPSPRSTRYPLPSPFDPGPDDNLDDLFTP